MASHLGNNPTISSTQSSSHATSTNHDLMSVQAKRRSLSNTRSPARTSLCSAASLSSDETSDSGFYQLNPHDGSTPSAISPRFIPKDWRRSPNPSDMSPSRDIDFFLKMLGEFREYVTDKVEYLETEQKHVEETLFKLQNNHKSVEQKWSSNEVELTQDINTIVNILHKKQTAILEAMQRKRTEESTEYKKAIESCRRNLKIINGVLAYSNRIKMETTETIRAHTVNELKQRLSMVNELFVEEPDLVHDVTKDRLEYKEIQTIKNILNQTEITDSPFESIKMADLSAPIIMAQEMDDDISSNSITVKWFDRNDIVNCPPSYEVRWSFIYKGSTLERKAIDVEYTCFTIEDLQPNCVVTVNIRGHYGRSNVSPYSTQATFRTLSAPQKFTFDATTAHSKLKLSKDCNTVYYPGDGCPKNPHSPGRFSFALNVLGSLSVYTGKHYWEANVNKDGWAVGLAYRSVARNSWLGSNDSSWVLHFNPTRTEYKVRHNGEATLIEKALVEKQIYMKKLGVFVNFDLGVFAFVNADVMKVIYTCHVGMFKEPICAAANPFYHGGSITIRSGLDIPILDFNNHNNDSS